MKTCIQEKIKKLEDEKMYLITAIKESKIEGLLERYDLWRKRRENRNKT